MVAAARPREEARELHRAVGVQEPSALRERVVAWYSCAVYWRIPFTRFGVRSGFA